MPLLTSDLYDVMRSCVDGRLDPSLVTFNQGASAVAVVTVSEGYPGKYPKGEHITGI